MKAKIRKGVFVGQDFGVHKWPHHESYDVDQVFEVSELDINTRQDRIKLIANGFGMLPIPGKYGNGALYVKKEDLIFVKELKKVAAARDIGEKFGKDQVIILMLDRKNETLEYASWGKTEYWCKNAERLAEIVYKKIAVEA